MKSIYIFSITALLCSAVISIHADNQGGATGETFAVQVLLSDKHLDPSDKKFKRITDIHEEICPGIFKYKYTTGYPKTTLANGQQGRLLVGFTINEKGKIMNANVIGSLNEELDSEALRVIRMMPEWKPGMKDGKMISVNYLLPLDFYAPPK